MNLNFLDPSKLPDRIDSTLVIPQCLHPPMPEGLFDKKGVVKDDKVADEEGDEAAKISKKRKLFENKISLSLNTGVVDEDNLAVSRERDGQQLQQQDEMKEASMEIDEPGNSNNNKEASETMKQKQDTTSHCQDETASTDSSAKTPPPKKKKKESIKPTITKQDLHLTAWTSCHSISFNPQGTYIASGHGSGLLPVHSLASRCLNAVYYHPPSSKFVNGLTTLAWDTSGKYLIGGSYGDTFVRFMDNSHPIVGWECAESLRCAEQHIVVGSDALGNNEKIRLVSMRDAAALPDETVYLRNSKGQDLIPIHLRIASLGKGRTLHCRTKSFAVGMVRSLPSGNATNVSKKEGPTTIVPCIRHPQIKFQLPRPLGGPIQFHPNHNDICLTRLIDGSLALFHIPTVGLYEMLPHRATHNDHRIDLELTYLLEEEEKNVAGNIVYLVPSFGMRRETTSPCSDGSTARRYSILCATFGKTDNSNTVYAVTTCGLLLGLEIRASTIQLLRSGGYREEAVNEPTFAAKIVNGAMATQIVANERFILVNSSDALRLYRIEDLKETTKDETRVPEFVFQDPVSKAPWISCDFLLDEYIVGGCNSHPQPGDNYQLYIWNAVTGELLDQLTGPQVSLYCLNCHPTRPFIAVGSSDGIIDIWGYRTDWIAFAPDFQALKENVLYEEKEDEFDIVIDGDEEGNDAGEVESPEEEHVDIITKMESPVNLHQQFHFNTRVLKMMKDKPTKKAEHD